MSQHYEPTPAIDAVIAYGVYANYDGMAPNTCPLILLSTQELAEQVRAEIKANYNEFFCVEGHENSKSWKIITTVALRENVCCSFDEAVEQLAD